MKRSFFLIVLLAFVSNAFAQLPRTRIYALHPAGGKVGTTVDLKITSGSDLDGLTALKFSHPGITAAQKQQAPTNSWPLPKKLETAFSVTIKADVPPGAYEARAVGRHGVSNARIFVVSNRNEILEPAPNDSIADAKPVELGTIINGVADNGGYDMFKFAAKAGQRIIIDCQAERIDSKLDASMVLYDAKGRELLRDRNTIGRDPLIDFTAPSDGEYIVQVHDAVYVADASDFYRLSISDGPHVDFVFPPAGMPGTNNQYTVYGRNIGGSPVPGSELTINGDPLEKLTVQIQLPKDPNTVAPPIGTAIHAYEAAIDAISYQLKTNKGRSNPVRVGFATAKATIEKEPNNDPAKATKLTAPAEAAGWFSSGAPGSDDDWFEFEAKKGTVYRIDVFSHRLGYSTDVSMLIQQVTKDAKGKELVKDLQEVDDSNAGVTDTAFDTTTSDPSYRFAAPTDGKYRVLLRNINPGLAIYRLAIRPEQPDFHLIASSSFIDPQRKTAAAYPLLVYKGGVETIDILALRHGFNGDIQITAENLPQGVKCDGTTIAAGRNSAPLIFTASSDAADWVGPIRIIGKAKVNDTEITREARGGEVQWSGRQNAVHGSSRVTGGIALAVGSSWTFPFAIDLAKSKSFATARGGKISIPVKVTRQGGFKETMSLKVNGLPKEITAKAISLDAKKNEGTLELTVQTKANATRYSATIATATQVKFAKDKDASKRAAEDKKKITEIVKKFEADYKQAADNAKAAAKEAKPELDKLAKEAKSKLDGAKTALKTADANIKKAATLAKENNVKISVPVAVFTLDVTPLPLKVEIGKPSGALKPEGKVEIPVTIERLYGFADEVTLELELPKGFSGVKPVTVKISKDQTTATIVAAAAKKVTAGKHQFRIEARAKFNNQNLENDHPFEITIEAGG